MSHKIIKPFYIGQQVVAVRNGRNGQVKKGEIKTVLDLVQCICGSWKIDVGLMVVRGTGTMCLDCNNNAINTDYRMLCSVDLFAPINETFQPISLSEVLENETQLISSN